MIPTLKGIGEGNEKFIQAPRETDEIKVKEGK